jgi:hypothetical protein
VESTLISHLSFFSPVLCAVIVDCWLLAVALGDDLAAVVVKW